MTQTAELLTRESRNKLVQSYQELGKLKAIQGGKGTIHETPLLVLQHNASELSDRELNAVDISARQIKTLGKVKSKALDLNKKLYEKADEIQQEGKSKLAARVRNFAEKLQEQVKKFVKALRLPNLAVKYKKTFGKTFTVTDPAFNKEVLCSIDPAFKALDINFKNVSKSYNNDFDDIIEIVKDTVDKGHKSNREDFFAWLDIDFQKQENDKSIKLASKLKQQGFKHIELIGQGGSAVNGSVIYNTFTKFNPKRKFDMTMDEIQTTVDPDSLQTKLKNLGKKFDKTVFIFGSKSGTTAETIDNMHMVIDFFIKKHKGDLPAAMKQFAKQAVFITEPSNQASEKNILHKVHKEIEEKYGAKIPILHNDQDIGGRYSFFSPTGMFIAELLGLNSKGFITGAHECIRDFLNEGINSDIAMRAVLETELAKNHNYEGVYNMFYSEAEGELQSLCKQLRGEGLIKPQVPHALPMFTGLGTRHLHSDVEQICANNHPVLFDQVVFNDSFNDHVNGYTGLKSLEHLHGKSHREDLLNSYVIPLRKYLLEGEEKQDKRPVVTTFIKDRSEQSIGYFVMSKMLEAITIAGIQGREALEAVVRQEAVEAYKNAARAAAQNS